MKYLSLVLGLSLLSFLGGCQGDSAQNSIGVNGTLTQLGVEASEEDCPNGGVTLEHGIDTNQDGELSADEVIKTYVICHGRDGSDADVTELRTELDELKARVAQNDEKVGISDTQADAIEENSSKVGLTDSQAGAIAQNTAKVGISQTQINIIAANAEAIGDIGSNSAFDGWDKDASDDASAGSGLTNSQVTALEGLPTLEANLATLARDNYSNYDDADFDWEDARAPSYLTTEQDPVASAAGYATQAWVSGNNYLTTETDPVAGVAAENNAAILSDIGNNAAFDGWDKNVADDVAAGSALTNEQTIALGQIPDLESNLSVVARDIYTNYDDASFAWNGTRTPVYLTTELDPVAGVAAENNAAILSDIGNNAAFDGWDKNVADDVAAGSALTNDQTLALGQIPDLESNLSVVARDIYTNYDDSSFSWDGTRTPVYLTTELDPVASAAAQTNANAITDIGNNSAFDGWDKNSTNDFSGSYAELSGSPATITSTQATAITANSTKVGLSAAQASAIEGNSQKVGITTSQANAITANTSKVSFPGFGTTAGTALEGNTVIPELTGYATQSWVGDQAYLTSATNERTVVVAPVGTESENGEALLEALSLVEATEAERMLLLIEPGVYDIGNNYFDMKSWVDVAGAGKNMTRIKGNWPYVVRGAANTVLRDIGVEAKYTGVKTADNMVIKDVLVTAIQPSSCQGIRSSGIGVKIKHTEIILDCENDVEGIELFSGDLEAQDVRVQITSSTLGTKTGIVASSSTVLDSSNLLLQIESEVGHSYGVQCREDCSIANSQISLTNNSLITDGSYDNYGLSVQSTTGALSVTETAIYVNGGVYGAGIYSLGSLVVVKDSSILTNGSHYASGIEAACDDMIVRNTSASVLNELSSGRALVVSGSSGVFSAENSSFSAPTYQSVRASGGTLKIANSMLEGTVSTVGGGSLKCVSAYDASFDALGTNCQ